jgi:N-methylhydantoinase A
VLLHSYAHPEHEQRLAHALRRTLPDTHVSLSHEVVGTFREYERAATTEIDAALSPLLARYLTRLVRRADDAGLPEPAIMQSNGGLIDAAAAARHAAWTVLSGPAAGAAGAAWAARRSGIENALCFDMGGTSCDVCVVDRHGVREQGAGEIAGRPLALPMLEVHTVGAGGGSIAWRDPGGALRVGPRSSGADPGPACYGRGGTEPTVTDANVVLGYLAPDAPLAGGIELRAEAATTAITHLAQQLGLDTTACAEGIVRVANAEMTRALRVVTVERGVDPRGYALVAFGGAGPLHAAAIAEELQIRTIVCPRASGVLAALGLITSARRRDAQRTVLLSGRALTRQAVAKAVAELGRRARDELGDPAAGGPAAELQAVYELRYRGQSFELPVGAGPEPSIEDLREAFDAAHEERYGYRDPEQELELVTIRVSATLSAPELPLAAETGAGAQSTRRRAILHGEEIEFEVLRGSPEAGARISGPAIVELPEATLLVPPTWSGEADSAGTIVLTR